MKPKRNEPRQPKSNQPKSCQPKSRQSEQEIQNEIRVALSEHGIVLRLNSGKFWQGKLVYSNEFKQKILINLRPIQGCPTGTSDLLFLGNNSTVAFIETKTEIGKLKPEQKNFLTLMEQRGIIAGVARSVEEAIRIIGGRK